MAEETNTMLAGDADQTARMAQPAGVPEMQAGAVEAPTAQIEVPAEQVTAPIEQAAEQVTAPVEQAAEQVTAPVEQAAEQVTAPAVPTAEIPVPAPPTAPIADPYPAPTATVPIAEPVAAPSGYAAPAAGFAGVAAAANAYTPQPAQPAPPAYQQPDAYQGAYQSQDFNPNQPIPPYTPAGEVPLTALTGGMKFGWLVVGFFLTIAGMVLAWLVNADKHPQVKKEAITWAVIGFGINAAIGIIACLAFAGMIAAGIYGSAMDSGYAGIISGLFV